VPADFKGFIAVMGTNITEGHQPQFSENSYAFVSREYMLFNIRMGYHYATTEALVTGEPSANYVRMQFKEGGAPLERRVRRIRLICDLLRRMGFETSSQGDFLDATLAYQDAETLVHRLGLLGRLNIMTKQLDMALSNDQVTQWYTDDFARRLGLLDAPAAKAAQRPGTAQGAAVGVAPLPPETGGSRGE
jgi:pyruvate,water dikinase